MQNFPSGRLALKARPRSRPENENAKQWQDPPIRIRHATKQAENSAKTSCNRVHVRTKHRLTKAQHPRTEKWVSEQHGCRRRKCGPCRTKVIDRTAKAQSTADGIRRAAGRAVEPSDQPGGMADQKIVAHRIDAAMITGRQDDGFVRRSRDPLEARPIPGRKTHRLPLERNDGDQPQSGTHCTALQHGFGSGEVEPYGHAAEERTAATSVSRPDRPAQGIVGLAAVGAMARKGDGRKRIADHDAKIAFLARTLQNRDNESLKFHSHEKHRYHPRFVAGRTDRRLGPHHAFHPAVGS